MLQYSKRNIVNSEDYYVYYIILNSYIFLISILSSPYVNRLLNCQMTLIIIYFYLTFCTIEFSDNIFQHLLCMWSKWLLVIIAYNSNINYLI